MAWFRDARFGLFIHWGLYAVPAGEWAGKSFHGDGPVLLQQAAKIPVAGYTPLQERFNPVKYDPEAWVRLAKDAGMKYLVITSKHHDGFCLWDSAHTDWDIAATPYQKDLLKPLAVACRRHGLKLCFYHSIMDWHHPEYGDKANWRGNAANPAPDMDKYTAYMKAQLEELLTRYGPVGILWFDGEWEKSWTHERGQDLDDYVRSLQPSIIVNNRVDKGRRDALGFSADGGFRGDYGTAEQAIPPTGVPGVDWESCMTMNQSWSYAAADQDWKPADALIRNLIDIASKGGNFLLNIGPTAEGEIPAASIERLQAIGNWMRVNHESIHGTSASPFSNTPWGRCTVKAGANGRHTLYCHLYSWPAAGKFTVPTMLNKVLGARLLASPDAQLPLSPAAGGGFSVQLPGSAPDPVATVLALEIDGVPKPGREPRGDGTTAAASSRATAGPATPKPPLITKIGTLGLDLCESTPFVFKGNVYRLEWRRPKDFMNGNGYLRIMDRDTHREISRFGAQYRFPCALVEGDTVHVVGTRETHGWYGDTLTMFESKDLVTWKERPLFHQPGLGICNTSLSKTDNGYIMSIELTNPAGFPARFLTSKDLATWNLMPEDHRHQLGRYNAAHCLRWHDGWFYLFYLEAGKPRGYEQYVTRSRDLIRWDPSPLNPVLAASPEDKLVLSPLLTETDRAAIAQNGDTNNSDIDFCEFKGRLIINYCWGTQGGPGHEYLAEAEFAGTQAAFLSGWFPVPDAPGATQRR